MNPNDFEPLNLSEEIQNSNMLPFSTTTTASGKLNCTFCGPNIQKPLQEIADDHMGVVNCQKLWKMYGQRQLGTPGVTCFLCNKAKTKKYSNANDLDISHANVDKCFQIIFIKKLSREEEEQQSLTEIEMEHCDMVSAEQSFSEFEICADSEKQFITSNEIEQQKRQLKVNTENFVKIEEKNLETKQDKALSNIKFGEIKTLPVNVKQTKENSILKPSFQVKNESIQNEEVHSNLTDNLKTELPSTQGIKKDTKTSLPSICLANNSNEISLKTGVETPKCTSSSEIQSSEKLVTKPNIVSIVPESGAESLEQSQSNSHVRHLEKNEVYIEQKEVGPTENDSEPKTNITSISNATPSDALPVNAQLCEFDQTRPLNQVQAADNKYQLKIIAAELHSPESTFVGGDISECNKMETNTIKPESPINSCSLEELHQKQPSQFLGSSFTPKAKVFKAGTKKGIIKSETQQQESKTGKSNKGSKLTVAETYHRQIEASTECNQNQSNIFDQDNPNSGDQSKPETITTANPNLNKLKQIPEVLIETDQSSTEHDSPEEIAKSGKF